MRSKIHIAGHPLHPMLIPLPVACVIGALVSDIVARSGGYPGWYFMGYVLTIGAWTTGLVAALPGLMDYLTRIPDQTLAKRDATIHLVLNVSIVVLMIASWLVKNANAGPFTNWPSLILEIISAGALVASGWYGWTLVYKHRVGVDEIGATEKPVQRKIA